MPHLPHSLLVLQESPPSTASRRCRRGPPSHQATLSPTHCVAAPVSPAPFRLTRRSSHSPLVLPSSAPLALASWATVGDCAKAGAPQAMTMPVRSRCARTVRPTWPLWQLSWARPARPGPRGLSACRVERAASARGRSLGVDSGPALFFG
jgi:hypothetical protein